MKLYLSTTHCDEDGPMAMTGKMAQYWISPTTVEILF